MRRLRTLKLARLRRRALTIAANSLNSLVVPVFYIGISYLVIRFTSVELWGAFVRWLVIVPLAAHIVSWGNKEYLLRAFSRNPQQIGPAWQTSFLSRAALLGLAGLVVLFLGRDLNQGLLLLTWTVGLALFQSHEVLVVYRKDFLFAALVEMVTLGGVALAVLYLGAAITLDQLLLLFALANLLKGGIYLGRYHPLTLGRPPVLRGRFDRRYFLLAFPFFLLGFSGMLQSRIDLYAVNIFLSERAVGQYQVFINLMIYLQAVSAFILLPFVKSIYRLDYAAIRKMARRLFGLGLLLVIPALGAAHLMLAFVYGFNLSPAFLLAGGLFALPIYAYLPIIYALYKIERQTYVLGVNVAGTALNLLLNLILLPQLGMLGAIIASAAAQWAMLVAYLWRNGHLQENYAPSLPELS